MKNILSSITREEKNRILEMHRRASNKHYLTEQPTSETTPTDQPVGGGMKVDVGTTLGNGMNIKKFDTRLFEPNRVVFIQMEDNGIGQNFACSNHEQGKYKLSPKGELTQAESQALYDKFCKKESNTETTPTGQPVGGGIKVDVGTTLDNGMNIKGFETSNLKKNGQLFIYMDDNYGGQQWACSWHEQGKYKLSPKGELTQAESQALYDKFCKK